MVIGPFCLPCAGLSRRNNFGGDLADQLLVRAFDGQFGVFLHRHFDLGGNGIIERMGIAQRQIDLAIDDGGFEADALDFQFLDKALADALDHVIDEGAAQAVQRLGLRVFAVAADRQNGAFELGRSAGRQLKIKLALGAFHKDLLALYLNFDLRRHGHRLFSYSRHNLNSLARIFCHFTTLRTTIHRRPFSGGPALRS
jgi:hypothetical protein